MLTVAFYTVFVTWAVIAIAALVLCDIRAQREARTRVVKAQRAARQAPARRVAIGSRGF